MVITANPIGGPLEPHLKGGDFPVTSKGALLIRGYDNAQAFTTYFWTPTALKGMVPVRRSYFGKMIVHSAMRQQSLTRAVPYESC